MRGDGCYTECTIRKSATVTDGIIKGLMVFAGCAVTLLGMLIHPLILLVAAVIWYVITLIWPRFQVVYEYVFVDGQLDFDKILGGNARKHVKRIDMEQVLMVAPENSHALDGYRHLTVKPFDFTSLASGEGHRVYVIAVQGAKDTELIRFEPDETMVTLMKQKSPRKVSEY